MVLRAVGSRCGCDLSLFEDRQKALRALSRLGFLELNVSLERLADNRIGRSTYHRGVHPNRAPDTVDCSSFIKWLYGRIGVWLPRRAIQRWLYGQPVELEQARVGDLVFTAGRRSYYLPGQPDQGVGHVGLLTAEQLVVHAASQKRCVVATPLRAFQKVEGFRGIRRILPPPEDFVVLKTPRLRAVETQDDLLWIVRQHL